MYKETENIEEDYIKLEELKMLLEVNEICKKYNINYYLAYGSVLGAIRHKGFIPWDTDIDIMFNINEMKRFLEVAEKHLSDKYKLYSIDTYDEYDSLKPRIGMRDKGHHQIHVDIFPMVGLPNSPLLKYPISLLASILYKVFFFKKFKAKKFHGNNLFKTLKHRAVKLLLLPIPINLIRMLYDKLCYKYPIKESQFIFNICGSYGRKEIIPKKYLDSAVFTSFEGYDMPVPLEWDKYLKHIYGDYMVPRKE